jgi:hypothetical protein
VRYLPTTGRYFGYPKRDCCSCCSALRELSALSKKKKVQSLHTISQHNTQKHKLLSSCQFDATASAQNTVVAQQAAVSETNFTAHYRRSLLSLSYCVCREETASNSNRKKPFASIDVSEDIFIFQHGTLFWCLRV